MSQNDDLIDRRAAIEKLKDNLTYMMTFGADRSIDLINELPSAQPEQQWIPRSERPTKNNWYIVTLSNGAVTTRWYSNFHGWEWEEDPVAWQPLPAPYEERREE